MYLRKKNTGAPSPTEVVFKRSVAHSNAQTMASTLWHTVRNVFGIALLVQL